MQPVACRATTSAAKAARPNVRPWSPVSSTAPSAPCSPKAFPTKYRSLPRSLSADKRVNPDVLALTGASAACHISKMPFLGPIVGARVGYVDGEFVLYPTYKGIEERSSLNLVFAATRDAMVMVEGGGNFVSEDMVADALAWGHEQVAPLFDLQDALREKVGVAKLEVTAPERDEEVAAFLGDFISADLEKALTTPEKMVRYAAKDAAKQKAKEAVAEKFPEDETKLKAVGDIIGDMTKKIVRERIGQGRAAHRRS